MAEKLPGLYDELLKLDEEQLVLNREEFECSICFETCAPKEGAVLMECIHSFCKPCLVEHIKTNSKCEIVCPYADSTYSCEATILHCELKELLNTNEYVKILERSIKSAEVKCKSMVQCKTKDCWGIYDVDDAETFTCDVCRAVNCVKCNAIHPHLSCNQYRMANTKDENAMTESFNDLIKKKNAIRCPICGIYIEKISGCDGLTCTHCNTDICWATKGPRWGPRGKNDTSGGCRCSPKAKCHPNCRNCH